MAKTSEETAKAKIPKGCQKDFIRRYGSIALPALLTDLELKVICSNEPLQKRFRFLESADGLRSILPEDSSAEAALRVAGGMGFHLDTTLGALQIGLDFIPVQKSRGPATGAVVLVSCPEDRPVLQPKLPAAPGINTLSRGLYEPLDNTFLCLSSLRQKLPSSSMQVCLPLLKAINLNTYQIMRTSQNLEGFIGPRPPQKIVDFWARLSLLLEACQADLRGSGIPFSWQLPSRQEDTVYVNCRFRELELAMVNLIANACLYTRAGNRVTVTGRTAAGQVEVTVADLGQGIPPQQVKESLLPFLPAEEEGDIPDGVGLGFCVVRRAVRGSGGTVAISSVLGEGTTVTLSLPRCERPAIPPAIMESEAVPYHQDRFAAVHVGLCDVVSHLPQQ